MWIKQFLFLLKCHSPFNCIAKVSLCGLKEKNMKGRKENKNELDEELTIGFFRLS